MLQLRITWPGAEAGIELRLGLPAVEAANVSVMAPGRFRLGQQREDLVRGHQVHDDVRRGFFEVIDL